LHLGFAGIAGQEKIEKDFGIFQQGIGLLPGICPCFFRVNSGNMFFGLLRVVPETGLQG
jgi:hypothetical protein